MKTSISVPTEIFVPVEQNAKHREITCSEINAALELIGEDNASDLWAIKVSRRTLGLLDDEW